MQGMSERQYAAHVGLSRGAIQKAKDTGRLVQHADGSIDAAASDARRAAMTDPAKQRGEARKAPVPKLKPVMMQKVLEAHVRAQLESLAEVRIDLR